MDEFRKMAGFFSRPQKIAFVAFYLTGLPFTCASHTGLTSLTIPLLAVALIYLADLSVRYGQGFMDRIRSEQAGF